MEMFRVELGQQGIDDTGDLQLATRLLGYAGEELSRVHRVQPFGFTSLPPAGAHGIGLALRGVRDLVAALGIEHPQYRPKNREAGSTAIYDQNGNIVSLVQAEIRIVHATKIHLVAPTITLEGTVKLGGDDASAPAAMQGTVDTGGYSDQSNLATKVLVK